MGLLISHLLAAVGPPFFGFLFDITGGYGLSFAIFGVRCRSFSGSQPYAEAAAVRNRWSDGVLE